jgi:hypothetical protein
MKSLCPSRFRGEKNFDLAQDYFAHDIEQRLIDSGCLSKLSKPELAGCANALADL